MGISQGQENYLKDIIIVFLFIYLYNTLALHIFYFQVIIKMSFFIERADTADLDLQHSYMTLA